LRLHLISGELSTGIFEQSNSALAA